MPNYKQIEKKIAEATESIGDIRSFEEHFHSIASKIKSVEIAPLKLRGDDLEIDLKETRKEIRSLRKDKTFSDWGSTMDRLNDIADTAIKFGEVMGKGLSTTQLRSRLLEDILVSTRDSVRFQGMMESASKSSKSKIKSGEELFYMIVRDGMKVPAIDKRGFLTRLNAKLKSKGYEPINRQLLNMI